MELELYLISEFEENNSAAVFLQRSLKSTVPVSTSTSPDNHHLSKSLLYPSPDIKSIAPQSHLPLSSILSRWQNISREISTWENLSTLSLRLYGGERQAISPHLHTNSATATHQVFRIR